MNVEDVGGLIVVFVALIVYVGLIVLGIKIARSKNRSPHWMWFAVHPAGLIIVLIVMACLRPLKECPQCAEKLKSHARMCSYCGYNFQPAETRATPTAVNHRPDRQTITAHEPASRSGDGTVLGDCVAKRVYKPVAASEPFGYFDPAKAPFRTFPNGKTGLMQGQMADVLIQTIPASRSVFGTQFDDNQDLSVTLALKLGLSSTREVLDAFQALVQKDAIAKYLMVTTTMPFFLSYSTNQVIVIAEVEHELKLNTLANLLLTDPAFSTVASVPRFERVAESLFNDRKDEVEKKKQWAVELQQSRQSSAVQSVHPMQVLQSGFHEGLNAARKDDEFTFLNLS